VDGRDRQVDVYNWHLAHPGENWPPLVYWGKYVAHDNNRDAIGLSLKLTRNVLNTFTGWNAQVLHDLHESVPYLYDNTIGDGPYNAWIDPILTDEWQMIGWNNVSEMTKFGMPGVFAHGNFDTWSLGWRTRDLQPAHLPDLRGDLVVPIERTTPPYWFLNRYNNQLVVSSRHLREECVGDIVDMLKLPEGQSFFQPQTVTIHQVQDVAGAPWEPDPTGDVLLLGDSFTNVFSMEAPSPGARWKSLQSFSLSNREILH